jgi:acetyltransferase-like isoleucine patch superfamily enzyme
MIKEIPPWDFEAMEEKIHQEYLEKRIHPSVEIGEGTRIESTAILQEGCKIGKNCFVGNYVVMRPNTRIGDNTKIGHLCVFEGNSIIGSNVLIHAQCHITMGTIIEDAVFLGPGVIGINDRYMVHMRRHIKEFVQEPFIVRRAARIGSGAIILPRVEIGENAVVGAGAVVTRNVGPKTVVLGNPARFVMMVPEEEII